MGRDGDIHQQRRHLLATDARGSDSSGIQLAPPQKMAGLMTSRSSLPSAVVDEVLLKLDAAGTDAQGLLLDDVVAMAHGSSTVERLRPSVRPATTARGT